MTTRKILNNDMASFHDLTTAQLRQAVQIREQIESLQGKLSALLGGSSPATKTSQGPTRGKRTLSAATKKKMAAAQQMRWAKTKGASSTKVAPKPAQSAKPASKNRKAFSPETRAKLAAAMKARWAARKKGGAAPNTSAS